MLKNLLAFGISALLCVAVFWWVAPLLLTPAETDDLPGYADLVKYDPANPGGHLVYGVDTTVRGGRTGEGVSWVTNQQGFRNRQVIATRPADGTLRILFYGDSFVDGMRTDQDDTIGAVLERQLTDILGQKVEVIISGHNNPANAWYHWQTHGRDFHPHIVLIGLTMGNDLVSHNFGAGVLPVLESMEYMVRSDPESSMAGIGSADAMIPAEGFLPEDKRSAWTQRKARWNQNLAQRFPFFAHRMPPAIGPRAGQPGEVMAAGFYTSLGLYYRGSIPFIDSAWRDFETMLPGFVEQVRYFGANPVLVMFPARIAALPHDWQRMVDALQLDPAQFDTHAPARHVLELCQSLDLPCLDTTPALQDGYEEGEVFRPLGDMHLNEHGQAMTAAALAAYLPGIIEAWNEGSGPSVTDPDAWLEGYRRTVLDWQREVVLQESPWLDPQDGTARLVLAEHRAEMAAVLASGFTGRDGDGPFWSAASEATLRIPVLNPDADLQVSLQVKPFLHEANGQRQQVLYAAGGVELGEQLLSQDDFASLELAIPAAQVTAPWTTIRLSFPDALVPAEIGVSADKRQLGIAVIAVEIVK